MSCYSTYIEAPGVKASFEAESRAVLRGMSPASVVDAPETSSHGTGSSKASGPLLAGEALAESSHAAAGLGNLRWSISTVATIPQDCVDIHAAAGSRAVAVSSPNSQRQVLSELSIARGVDCGYGYGAVNNALSPWKATRADVEAMKSAQSQGWSYSNMVFGIDVGNSAATVVIPSLVDRFELDDGDGSPGAGVGGSGSGRSEFAEASLVRHHGSDVALTTHLETRPHLQQRLL